VSTEIELENNQSFAIAGLIDNQVTENLSKVPGLGDIPLLGKLFQSKSVTKNNTELLVVVTPELVQPIQGGVQPQVPMPSPFLKDGATKLPDSNQPNTSELPKQPQMPFEPSGTKPAVQPASPTPATSLANTVRDALRRETP
jgi:pilus assembly protein CpaC